MKNTKRFWILDFYQGKKVPIRGFRGKGAEFAAKELRTGTKELRIGTTNE